ncbi:MAG: hypothetical protein WBW33_37635 [Bryobacteraceae bacterium]
MGFLDNLENSLKSLESQGERDGSERLRQEEERNRRAAEAPWADQLKQSEFTRKLFDDAAAAGHRLRTKIYVAWLATTLRLEARGRRLELRPTPAGIVAVFIPDPNDGQAVETERPLQLDSDPADLLREWLP